MNSFTLFFKKSQGFFGALLLVLLIEVFIGFAPFMKYLDPTGVYYTTLKREIAESEQNYDYIMLGDSRSLSIKGKPGDDSNPSFYNFSLPAAGTRYLIHFVEKYLQNNNPPKGIIFAIDPEQFKPSQSKAFHVDPKIWMIFKHRLLNLFSLTENLKQYEGKEAYFILKESVPILIPSVSHREGLEKLLTSMKIKDFQEGNFPYYKSNKRLESLTASTYGQVNLGTYLEIPPGITLDMIQQSVDNSINNLDHDNVDLSTLDDMINFAEERGIDIYLLEVPHASGMAETKFYKKIRREFQLRAETYDHVHVLKFPDLSYPIDHFAEGIHFNEKGEKRVNKEFDSFIWNRILDLRNP
jgi:hypothetical protein